MPDAKLLTRGKQTGVSVGTGVNTDELIETSDYSTLIVEADLSAGAAGDLAVVVNPVSEVGDEIMPIAWPPVQSVGPTLSGGRSYYTAQFDVQAQNRVRLRITNNNVGTQSLDYAWRLA